MASRIPVAAMHRLVRWGVLGFAINAVTGICFVSGTPSDMNKGEHVWMMPLGDGRAVRNHPRLKDLNLPPVGGDSGLSGPLLTKTLFISAVSTGGKNDDGPRLVARDKATGRELASVDLPSGAIGTPMTYMIEGKQYIALTVGGDPVPELVAFTLP